MPSNGSSRFRANVGGRGGQLLNFTHSPYFRFCLRTDGWNDGFIVDFRSMRVKVDWVRSCRSLMMAGRVCLCFLPPFSTGHSFSLDNTRPTDDYNNDKILFVIIMNTTKFRLPCSKFDFWVILPTALTKQNSNKET